MERGPVSGGDQGIGGAGHMGRANIDAAGDDLWPWALALPRMLFPGGPWVHCFRLSNQPGVTLQGVVRMRYLKC